MTTSGGLLGWTNVSASLPNRWVTRVAVDPTNPARIVIGWRQFDTISNNFRQAGNAYSTDGGQTFTKALVEWNLPPLRFDNVGWPGFFVSWLRPSLFSSGLVTSWDDRSDRREVGNAGFQLDLRFGVLSRLDMTLSVGYAHAFESDMPSSDEFMISLKIL